MLCDRACSVHERAPARTAIERPWLEQDPASERACRLSAHDGAFRAIGRTSELQAGYRTLSPKIVGSGPRCFSDGRWLKRLFDRGILMSAPICLISGVGPGTGSALAKRFTEGGYRVALLARNEARLLALEKELVTAKGYPCDVSDPAQIDRVASQIERDLGSSSVVIHNAVGGAFGTFREIDPSILNRNFQVNTMGLLYLAGRFSPAMIDSNIGAIVVTGNTSALRGKPSFAGFARTKAAQRILAEAMARELGPKGVHVAYLVVDAVIDLAWTRERFKDRPDEFFIKPRGIAWFISGFAWNSETPAAVAMVKASGTGNSRSFEDSFQMADFDLQNC